MVLHLISLKGWFHLCSKTNLDEHITSIHENKKELQCMICKKPFNLAARLQAHVKRVHNKIKKHVCQICECRFATTGELKYHSKSNHES